MTRVLIVDDDPLFRNMVTHSLQLIDVDVSVAANGQVALEMLAENAPQVIILDLQMPHTSGYELIRWLRNSEKHQSVKIVAVTGDRSAQSQPEAQMVDALLMKPLSIKAMLEQVQNLLASRA